MESKLSQPIKLFYCYTRKDRALRDELDTHLAGLRRSGLITAWYDGEISPGTSWEKEIETHLDTAQMILLLVSPDFLDSDYCYSKEMALALERHHAREARVIPILLRPSDWANTPSLSALQVLPSNAIPVTRWSDRDEAFEEIVKGIHRVVDELHLQQITTHDSPVLAAPQVVSPSSLLSVSMIPISPPARKSRSSKRTLFAVWFSLAAAIAIIIVVVVASVKSIFSPSLVPAHATATAQSNFAVTTTAIAKNPYGGTLSLDDPLSDNSKGYQWTESSDTDDGCAFIGGAYHVSENVSGFVHSCGSTQVDFKDFAFQVRVTIVKGDGGGINFRWDSAKGTGYEFEYAQEDGTYVVRRYDNSTGWTRAVVNYTPSTAINKGLGNANTLAVVVKGSNMSFYANRQLLASASDSTYSHGEIGFIANDGSATVGHPTDVAYSNAEVWTF